MAKVTPVSGHVLYLTKYHDIIVCDTSSNVVTIYLPDAKTTLGKSYLIIREKGMENVYVDCQFDTENTFGDGYDRIDLNNIGNHCRVTAISEKRWFVSENTGLLDTQ